jgi:radical SAM protein with 4Fe4S-binding SPASM domain
MTDKKNDEDKDFLEQSICGVGYDNCCITANGDVYPCAGWQDYVIGNIYKSSLSEIWENSEKIRVLRKLKNKSFPQCINCPALEYCPRCLVRNYNESGGDFMKVNPHFCAVAFKTKEVIEEYLEKKDLQ